MKRRVAYAAGMVALSALGWIYAVTVAFYGCGEADVVVDHPRFGRLCENETAIGQDVVVVGLAVLLVVLSVAPVLLRSAPARRRAMIVAPVVAVLLLVGTMQIPGLLGA